MGALNKEELINLFKYNNIEVYENSDNPGIFIRQIDGTLKRFEPDDILILLDKEI